MVGNSKNILKMSHIPTTCAIVGYAMLCDQKKKICNDASCKEKLLMPKFRTLCRFYIGLGWEQKEFDENLMGTKRF